jgi:hypothetical protein
MPKTIYIQSNTATAGTCHLNVAGRASWLAFYKDAFLWNMLRCLTVPMTCGGNNFGDYSLQTRSIILFLYVGNTLSEWETVSDFDAKCNKWVKHLSHYKIFIHLE